MQKRTSKQQPLRHRFATAIAWGRLLLVLAAAWGTASHARAACLPITTKMTSVEEYAFDDLEGSAWRTKVVKVKITTPDLLKLIAIAQVTPTTFPSGSQLCFEGNGEPLRVRDLSGALLLEIPSDIASLEVDGGSVYSKTDDLQKGTTQLEDFTTANFNLDLTGSVAGSQLLFETKAIMGTKSSWKAPAPSKTTVLMKLFGTGHLRFNHPIDLPAHDYGSPIAFFMGDLTLKGSLPHP